MKHIIKHGSTVPTASDLDNYQLGYCTSNNKLYTKNSNNEIVCFNDSVLESGEAFHVCNTFSSSETITKRVDGNTTLSFVINSTGKMTCSVSTTSSDESLTYFYNTEHVSSDDTENSSYSETLSSLSDLTFIFSKEDDSSFNVIKSEIILTFGSYQCIVQIYMFSNRYTISIEKYNINA